MGNLLKENMEAEEGRVIRTMEDYDANETREEFLKRMDIEGFIAVEPKEGELQIDIDNEEQYEIFMENFTIFCREFPGAYIKEETYSKSGFPHRHIIIQTFWKKLSAMERIAWQAALGSDPKRELLSCIRQFFGDSKPTLFLEKRG